MLQRKILSLSNLSLFEKETIFSQKIISEKKKIIVMDLCPATFRSFVVQCLTSTETPDCLQFLRYTVTD